MSSISDSLVDNYDALPDTPAAEDLCPRAAAAAALQVAPTNEPARVTGDRFLAALKSRGMRYSVTWYWNGRRRDGRLCMANCRASSAPWAAKAPRSASSWPPPSFSATQWTGCSWALRQKSPLANQKNSRPLGDFTPLLACRGWLIGWPAHPTR